MKNLIIYEKEVQIHQVKPLFHLIVDRIPSNKPTLFPKNGNREQIKVITDSVKNSMKIRKKYAFVVPIFLTTIINNYEKKYFKKDSANNNWFFVVN